MEVLKNHTLSLAEWTAVGVPCLRRRGFAQAGRPFHNLSLDQSIGIYHYDSFMVPRPCAEKVRGKISIERNNALVGHKEQVALF